MNFDLVIFDCDGVLVDTEPIANRVLVEVLGELDLAMTPDECSRTFLGRSAPACWDIIQDRVLRNYWRRALRRKCSHNRVRAHRRRCWQWPVGGEFVV